jgi:uncharacterized protein (TIGR02145 family)
MKKQNFKKALPYLIITFFFVSSVAVIAAGMGGYQKYYFYHSNNNEKMTIVDYADRLRVVHNSSTKDYFIPNNSSEEWSSFENNLPPNVWLDVVSCDDDKFKYNCGSDCSYFDGFQNKAAATVLIGSQCWLNSNLETYQVPSGTLLEQWPPNTVATTTNHYACTENTLTCANGIFYQWWAALPSDGLPDNGNASSTPIRGICPAGWHIPLGYEIDALAAAVASHGCYNATTLAFSANCLRDYYNFDVNFLYGYRRGDTGKYLERDTGIAFRTASYSTPGGKFTARNFIITPDGNSPASLNDAYSKGDGVNVRCIKD